VDYTVVGIYNASWHHFHANGWNYFTLIDYGATVEHVIREANPELYALYDGSYGQYDVFIALKNPRNAYKFTENNAIEYLRSLPYAEFNNYEKILPNYNTEYLRALGVLANENLNTVLYALAAILITLIMLGSVLLIYNAFAISISERTKQFGMLKSVGATGKQLLKSVLFEGFCIGIVGIPLGILAGIVGIGTTLGIVGGIMADLMNTGSAALTLSVSFGAVLVAVLVGVLTIFISAYLPASRATRLSAIDSIRQTHDIKMNAKKMKTSKLTQKLFGLEGVLAAKNFKRNKKRYRSTAISLFVSVVLFISASAFGMYLRQTGERLLDNYAYDVYIQTHNRPDEFDEARFLRYFNEFMSYEEVYDGAYFQTIVAYTEIDQSLLSDRFINRGHMWVNVDNENPHVLIYLVDDITYRKYLDELKLDFTGKDDTYVMVAWMNTYEREHGSEDSRYVSYPILRDNKPMEFILENRTWNNNGEINEETEFKTVTVHFAEYLPFQIGRSYIWGYFLIAPYSQKDSFEIFMHEGSQITSAMTIFSDNPLRTVNAMYEVLEDVLIWHDDSTPNYFLTNIAEQEEQNRRILLVVNIFVYGFIILMSLITVANVFNTITTSINLRRREFAMLKSVGMTDGGLNKMMVFKCLLYGVKALLFALPVSAGVTRLIYNAVLKGVDVPFTLPWGSVGIAVAGVFGIVFITMMYAISKVKKENTVEALKSEIL
jgi:putative ABC transport system permease protein